MYSYVVSNTSSARYPAGLGRTNHYLTDDNVGRGRIRRSDSQGTFWLRADCQSQRHCIESSLCYVDDICFFLRFPSPSCSSIQISKLQNGEHPILSFSTPFCEQFDHRLFPGSSSSMARPPMVRPYGPIGGLRIAELIVGQPPNSEW